jgi:hypothetical protein
MCYRLAVGASQQPRKKEKVRVYGSSKGYYVYVQCDLKISKVLKGSIRERKNVSSRFRFVAVLETAVWGEAAEPTLKELCSYNGCTVGVQEGLRRLVGILGKCAPVINSKTSHRTNFFALVYRYRGGSAYWLYCPTYRNKRL